MPSRKRNKGKERKAKKAEARASRMEQHWLEWALWGQDNNKVQCDHGLTTESFSKTASENDNVKINGQQFAISDDHHIFTFIDSFFNDREKEDTQSMKCLLALFETQREVWMNDLHRKVVIEILTSMAVNLLLHEVQYGSTSLTLCLYITRAIIVLENYDGGDNLQYIVHRDQALAENIEI